MRFSNLICPKCESDKPFVRVKNRRSYQCPNCSFQLYPTKDTIFEKTTTPLIYWFTTIYLQTTTRNGVGAKELERQLNICYKTALRMAHQIKILMADKRMNKLTGIVQIDEAYLGMNLKNLHRKQVQKCMRKVKLNMKIKLVLWVLLVMDYADKHPKTTFTEKHQPKGKK